MSKLFQFQLINEGTYITRESNIENLYKSRFYELKRGCFVKNTILPNGQMNTNMFDLSKNTFFHLPIFIQSNSIIEIREIKKGSEFEELYLKVISGIILAKDGSKLN